MPCCGHSVGCFCRGFGRKLKLVLVVLFRQFGFFQLRFGVRQSFGGGIEFVVRRFEFFLRFSRQFFKRGLGIGGSFRLRVGFGSQFANDRFVRRRLFPGGLYFGSGLSRSFFRGFASVSGFPDLGKWSEYLRSRGLCFGRAARPSSSPQVFSAAARDSAAFLTRSS